MQYHSILLAMSSFTHAFIYLLNVYSEPLFRVLKIQQ